MRRLLWGAVLALAVGGGWLPAQNPGFSLEGEKWTYDGDGLHLTGIFLKPEGSGPFPAIVISHGSGGNAEGYSLTQAHEMVKWGLVCIGTDYTFAGRPGVRRVPVRRLAAAPPHTPASSAADRAENLRRGAKCIEILQSLPYVDLKRIALYGNSAGAIMTIALSGAFPGKIAAAAMTAGGVGGRFATPELAEKIRCPFLMIHGSIDPLVPPEASLQLKEILDRNHVPNQRKVFDGIGHNVNVDKRDEVNALVRDWFTKNGILR